MGGPGIDTPYWSQDAAELSAALGSGPGGLSSKRAAAKLRLVGPNNVEDASHMSALLLLLRQFGSPLVLILIFAAAVSLALQQWVDSAIILAIVLGSTLLGYFQEYRASAAVEQLKRRLVLTCRVIRDGVERKVPVGNVVPGDVIMLSAGDLIPADGLVIEAEDFLVNEATMTGESFPVEKRPGTVNPEATLSARTNAVFLGASVQSGEAKVLVVETGLRTAFGAIAARLRTREPETDFGRGVRQFGYLLIRAMVVIVLFVLTVNLLLSRPVIESLLFAVALAVGLSPELLPAIVSVTLSAGARAMGRSGVIVRRLEAIESLGSMDILCTDKTGTLTEGTIVLNGALDAGSRPSDEVRQLAFLNAAFETGIENPLDAAIMAAGKSAGLTTHGFTKIDEIPYDFLRRRLTIVVAEDGNLTEHLILTKGAFSNVLETCSLLERDAVDIPLTTELRTQLDAVFRVKGAEGFRILAVATRRVAAKPRYGREEEMGMTFRGFLIFFDPPKADARRTIHDLAQLGIRIKVISGDNRYVTAHLAEAVGLNSKSMLTGDDLGKLKDEALWHRAPRTDLFVEIDPQQKERIVRALQKTGHSVGYLGDGINDAPALHAADVGISVDGAVEVARESADLVLLRSDLDVLCLGVEEGRRTFANTLKYIGITTSANFGNMVSMALAAPLLPFLPLAAKQILLNNFLSDLPSVAISSDRVDADRLATAQHWDVRDLRRYMLVFGLTSTVFDLLTFWLLLKVFDASEPVFQTAWFVVSLLTELVVVLLLRTHLAAWKSRPSTLLWTTTVLVAAVAVALPFIKPAAALFGLVELSAPMLGSLVLVVVGYAAATEFAKRHYRAPARRRRRSGARARPR